MLVRSPVSVVRTPLIWLVGMLKENAIGITLQSNKVELWRRQGNKHTVVTRIDAPASPQQKAAFKKLTPEAVTAKTLAGEPITGKRPDAIVEIGICRTFQQIRLFPNMTALENVFIGVDARHQTSIIGAMFRGPRYHREEREGEAKALELLWRHVAERRHRRGGVHQGAFDRRRRQPRADLGQLGPWPVVAVLAEGMAGEAARGGRDLLTLLEPRRGGLVDLRRRPREGSEDGQVGHRGDRGDTGRHGDRPPQRMAAWRWWTASRR